MYRIDVPTEAVTTQWSERRMRNCAGRKTEYVSSLSRRGVPVIDGLPKGAMVIFTALSVFLERPNFKRLHFLLCEFVKGAVVGLLPSAAIEELPSSSEVDSGRSLGNLWCSY